VMPVRERRDRVTVGDGPHTAGGIDSSNAV
jgi:hypothetical protein